MDVKSSTEAIYENTKELEKENRKGFSSFRLLLVFLVIICILLLVSIAVLSLGGVKMKQQEEMIREHMKNSLHWENQTKHLKSENEKLKNETEQRSQLLKFILTFDTFPVNEHCSGKRCHLCLNGWFLFNETCYLISNDTDPGMSWEQSRQYCRNRSSDLFAVINLLQQESLSNHDTTDWLESQRNDIMVWDVGTNYTMGSWTYEVDSTGFYTAMVELLLYHTGSWNRRPSSWSTIICVLEAFTVSL